MGESPKKEPSKLAAAARKKTPGKSPSNDKRRDRRKGGLGRGNFLALQQAGVDLLAEMESVLADPDQKTTNPIRHNYLRMIRKDLPEFTRQYSELLKAKGKDAAMQKHGGSAVRDSQNGFVELQPSAAAGAELSEEEIRIEEAIDRVVEELTAARAKVESGSG